MRAKKTKENSKAKTIVYVYELMKSADLDNLKATDFENDFQVGVAEVVAEIIYKKDIRLKQYSVVELKNLMKSQVFDYGADEDAWKSDYTYGRNYGALMMRKLLEARETLKLFGELSKRERE